MFRRPGPRLGGRVPSEWSNTSLSHSNPQCTRALSLSSSLVNGLQPCKVNGTAVSQVRVFTNDSRSTFGFTGLVHGGPGGSWPQLRAGAHVVISFRGSIDDINYADNGDQVLIPYPREPAGGMVVRGFWNAYSSQRSAMLANLMTLLRGGEPVKGVVITGHSLGAGQAVLAALDLALTLPTSLTITMYTFGTPRVGDSVHAKRVRAATNLETWVVSHRADAEPRYGDFQRPLSHVPHAYTTCHAPRDMPHSVLVLFGC